MGRYWNMNSGAEGKFAVGLQDSDDACIFGLREEPHYINMYSDELDPVVEKLKELFKEVGEEFSEKYYTDGYNHAEERVSELFKRASERLKLPNYSWSSDETEEENRRISKAWLALDRIYMGVMIAQCIYEEGYCDMECEL